MNTKIINFVGGPCCGKSTISAAVFAELKLKQEVSCELVTEAIKDFVYDKNEMAMKDQLLITATQNHKIMRLIGEVQYIISDCALINAPVYNEFYNAQDSTLDNLALELFNHYDNTVFLLPRKPKYDTYGRSQNEDDAKRIDDIYIAYLMKNNIKYLDLRHLTHSEIPAFVISHI